MAEQIFSSQRNNRTKSVNKRGAVIAQWIRLRPPSCGPEFESQANYLRFLHLHL